MTGAKRYSSSHSVSRCGHSITDRQTETDNIIMPIAVHYHACRSDINYLIYEINE